MSAPGRPRARDRGPGDGPTGRPCRGSARARAAGARDRRRGEHRRSPALGRSRPRDRDRGAAAGARRRRLGGAASDPARTLPAGAWRARLAAAGSAAARSRRRRRSARRWRWRSPPTRSSGSPGRRRAARSRGPTTRASPPTCARRPTAIASTAGSSIRSARTCCRPGSRRSSSGSARLRGSGSAEQLRFASEFEPLDPEVRDVFLGRRSNRSAVVHLWRHAGGPRPTLICLHGHRQGHPSVDARLWDVRWLHRSLGFDVALFALPLHGPRTAGRRSGDGFLDGHPSETSAALAQSIWDLRRLAGWLQDEGAPALGVAGFGLGGFVAALFASLAPNLASVTLLAPIVSLETFAWRLLPPARRAEARAAGITDHWLSAAWARHDPRRLRPRVSHEARLDTGRAGRSDRAAARSAGALGALGAAGEPVVPRQPLRLARSPSGARADLRPPALEPCGYGAGIAGASAFARLRLAARFACRLA